MRIDDVHIRILEEWPERAWQRAEIERMFDRQMERAREEDARRKVRHDYETRIQSLRELLTLQEMEFILFLAKAYHKIKTIFN